MNSQNFAQQDDIFDPKAARAVTLIGAGSVGSQVAVMLASIGVNEIAVYDGDFVESHNIPMSAYRLRDLGRKKTEALAEVVAEKSGIRIDARQAMYAGEPLVGTVVACVDSMDARSLIWSRVRDNPNVDLFIDTRVDVEYVCVYAIKPCDPDAVAWYEEFLYPADQANRPMCGRHGIVYVAAQAALAAVSRLTEAWTSGRTERHFRMLVGGLYAIRPRE